MVCVRSCNFALGVYIAGSNSLWFFSALIVALVVGLLNAFVKPILLMLTLPVNVATLGLFTFIINALLIMLAAAILPGFQVANFWWALLFSIILSLVMSFIPKDKKL